jgi:hypothetical protein
MGGELIGFAGLLLAVEVVAKFTAKVYEKLASITTPRYAGSVRNPEMIGRR